MSKWPLGRPYRKVNMFYVLEQVEIQQGLGPVKAHGIGGYQLIDAGKVRRRLPEFLDAWLSLNGDAESESLTEL